MKFFIALQLSFFVFSACSSFLKINTLKWDSVSDSRLMSWTAAKRHCEENGKRLPSPDEAVKEWKSFDSSSYIWTSKEKDSASAYYVNLRLGEVQTDFKSNQFSTVCVCPSVECKAKVKPASAETEMQIRLREKFPGESVITGDLVWEFGSRKEGITWEMAKDYCEGQKKRLPAKEEALQYWKEFKIAQRIWISDGNEKNSDSSQELYTIYLGNGKMETVKRFSSWSTAVCVCPASMCGPAALKEKEELYWEPVKFVTASGGLKLREGPSAKTKSYCTVPEGSVLKISEKTDKKEIIDGKEDVWVKADFCGKSGYLFGGYLCSVKSEGCNDYNDFISAFRSVCSKGSCSSVKQYKQGDEGKIWKESSVFYEPGKEFYLGIKYNALGGTVVSVKKIRNIYYILYYVSSNSDPRESLRHIRVRIDPSAKKLFTHDPEKDYSLKLNDFSNQLIEYR